MKVLGILKLIKNVISYYSRMNTSQLECMIQCDPVLEKRVLGVYAADQLPSKIHGKQYGFIANTESSLLSGEHWCVFYDNGQASIQFFDSYGR